MKHFYKHRHGYINIDEENVYFTSTGNWQHAYKATEKKPVEKASLMHLLMFSAYIALIILFIMRENYIYLLFAAILFVQHLYSFITRTTHVPYKVPLSKITSVEIIKDGLVLHFKNAADEPDKQKIWGVQEEVVTVLSGLKA